MVRRSGANLPFVGLDAHHGGARLSVAMMDAFLPALVVVHAAATWYMAGLIWFVQVVHYPLFAAVPPDAFTAYERRHTFRTSFVVIPPMLIELACAGALLFLRPESVPLGQAAVGFALLVVVWLSTFLLQVPCHAQLERTFDARVIARLVATNWLRTAAWSLRALLAAWWLL